MDIRINIEAETDSPEVLRDAVKTLETVLPYMFDNVAVSSVAQSLTELAESETFVLVLYTRIPPETKWTLNNKFLDRISLLREMDAFIRNTFACEFSVVTEYV